MIDSLKSICSSIFKIITNKFKKLKKTQKIIILILLVILTIITVAFVYNVGTETSNNTEDFKEVKIETNNDYKTFDFTVNDILNIYDINIKDTTSNLEAPYCREHKGTNCLFLPLETDKYVEIRVVYENQTKKVISIDLMMSNLNNALLSVDNGLTTEEGIAFGGKYIYSYLTYILNLLGKEGNVYQKINDTVVINKLIGLDNEGQVGEYALLDGNIGCISAATSLGWLLRIIASDENEFYNLSTNSLTNLLLDNELKKEQESISTETHQDYETFQQRVPTKSNNITGIEQAIKDRAFEVTDDLSESKLKAAFTDGSLQYYYDNWEKCLEDAQKLNIITSDKPYLTMEEELEQQYYDEQNYNNQSYNREDNSVSNEQPILVKTYNTIKKEDSSDYHIIKIYKYSNGEYSYETDLYTYGSIIPSIISDRQYKTLDEALTSAIQNFREFPLTISDLTEE